MSLADTPPKLLGISLTAEFKNSLVALFLTALATYIGMLFQDQLFGALGLEEEKF